MLAALAVNWVFLLLRASVAFVFGLAVLMWPGLSPIGTALLFGAYALTDGLLALFVALDVRDLPGAASLIFEAALRLGVGLFASLQPAAVSLALPNVFATWAILSGAAALAAALALGRELAGEWPLPLIGTVSILMGVLALIGVVPPEPTWVVGPYAILFGFALMVLGLRLRQLAQEIGNFSS